MEMTMEEENIKVAVRIRPIQSAERKDGDIACVKASPDGKEVQVKVGPLEATSYRCNQCFPSDTTQAEFFNECGITELLDSSMKGYRTCAFAFGQTGAGKTFTMVGAPKGASNREKQSGLISRSLEYLFHKLEEAGVQFAIKLSCLEIYHEQVFDLFAEEKDRLPLPVREHAADGFFIEGCKLVDCASFPIASAALDAAVKNRQTGSHDLNSRSSRSHCLTEIHIEIPVTVGQDGTVGGGISYGGDGTVSGLTQGEYISRGKISLVDLAGSERLKSTKSTGKVLQEAGFINKSLYVLGKVIAGLIRTNGDLNHKDVPYRDSKLTKLLISSLGGRSRTLLISCVSEAKSNQAETLRTLKFSMSCARIRNKPMKFLDPQEKLILDLKEEIRRLRHENKKLRSNLLTAPSSGEKARLSEEEDASVMSRAYSAHSSLDKERLRYKPRNGGKIYGTKMQSSHSDYIKKLSPIKGHKSGGKRPKREMTKDEALKMLDDMRAATIARQQELITQQGAASYQGRLADNDESSVGSSVRSNARPSAPELEDLVRRRATGPMIFKGDSVSNMSPVRETSMQAGYAPAQNYMRSMDAMSAARIEELEKRIARMESGVLAAQKPFPHDHHNYSAAPGAQSMPLEQADGYESSQASLTGKRKKKKKATAAVPENVAPKVWKGKMTNSPYIAHLIEQAPKVAQDKQFGVRVVPADHPDQELTLPAKTRPPAPEPQVAEHASQPRPAGRNSADNLRAAVASASEPVPRSKAAAPQPQQGPAKDLHSSILDELAELGLGPVAPQAVEKKPKPVPKMTTKADEKESAAAAPPASKPRPAKSTNTAVRTKPAAPLPSLPAPVTEAAQKVAIDKPPAKEAKKAPMRGAAPKKPTALPPMQPKEKVGDKARGGRAVDDQAVSTPVKKNSTASDPAALRAKLEELERSLAEERERMEDNPGEVTAEAEEHYEQLAKEAKTLRRKLEVSGVDLTGSDDDGAPTPEAVRLMARELEKLNAPVLPAKQSSTVSNASNNSKAEVTKSPSKGATSAAKKDEAALSRAATIGAGALHHEPPNFSRVASVGATPSAAGAPVSRIVSNRGRPPGDTALMFAASIAQAQERTPTGLSLPGSGVGSPALSNSKLDVDPEPAPAAILPAIAASTSHDEDAYADDEFEQDASKPGTAQKKPQTPDARPAPLLQVKEFSRKFEQIELNVPDIGKFTKAVPEVNKMDGKHHSISEETINVADSATGTVAAVQDALEFNYGDFDEDHPQILALAKEMSMVPDKVYTTPSIKVYTPPSPKRTQEPEYGDGYGDEGFDQYEDEFAEVDAEIATASAAPVAAVSSSSVKQSAVTSPPAASTKIGGAEPPSQKVSAPAPAPAAADEADGDGYDDDHYEDEFEEDDGGASRPRTVKSSRSRRGAPDSSPTKTSSVKQESPAPAAKARDSEDDYSYEPSSKAASRAAGVEETPSSYGYSPSQKVVPAAVAASVRAEPQSATTTAAADEEDFYPDFDELEQSKAAPAESSPAPAPRAAPVAAAAAPSVKSASPSKTAGGGGDEEDEYGADEFDDYDVSFKD